MTVKMYPRVYVDWDDTGDFDGPSSANRITNGDFADGENNWTFFGGIVHTVAGGKLEAYRNGGSSAAFYQEFAYLTSTDDEFTVSFKIANPSGTNKDIQVLVQSAGAAETWHSENYTINAGAGETTKSFAALADNAASGVRLAFVILTDDNDPELTFDDISVITTHDKDEISIYTMGVDQTNGMDTEWDAIADVGQASLQLRNDDKRFTPDYALSPYFGKLLPKKAAKVTFTDGTTEWGSLRGETRTWLPDSGKTSGPFTCMLNVEDLISVLNDVGQALPNRENVTADVPLKQILAEVFGGGLAEGWAAFVGDVGSFNGDTLCIGDNEYTFGTVLADDVVIAGATSSDTAENLAAAVNADIGSGTVYAANISRHPNVAARVERGTSHDAVNQNTFDAIFGTGTTYTRRGQVFTLSEKLTLIYSAAHFQASVGTPAGTITWRLETLDANDFPSGTLADVNATATLLESSVAAGWNDWLWADEFTLEAGRYALVASTDTPFDGANYTKWGAESPGTYADGRDVQYNSSTPGWEEHSDTRDLIFSISSRVVLYANAQGAWANSIILEAQSNQALAASVTSTKGVVESGTLADTYTENQVYYVWEEETGAPGFDPYFDFNVTGLGEVFAFWGRYDPGSVGHTVQFRAWDWVALTWDVLGTLVVSGSDVNLTYTLDADHTSGGDVVRIQIYHSSPGNTSHRLNIDHMHVLHSLPSTAEGVILSDAFMLGGSDAPAGLTAIDDGIETLQIAGDQWTEGRTTAMHIVRNIVESEPLALFYADGDGVLTYHDRNWIFEQVAAAATLTLDGDDNGLVVPLSIEDTFNYIIVTYVPRGESATAVIVARLRNSIEIPGKAGVVDWTRHRQAISYTLGDTDTEPIEQTIPYVETDTGEIVGAKDLIAPEAGTDYAVVDEWDFDYTTKGQISVGLGIAGGEIRATFANAATGRLYVENFQVRGTALIAYEPQEIIRQDADSVSTYGRRRKRIPLPLPISTVFAESVSSYYRNRYGTPQSRLKQLRVRNNPVIDSTNIFSVDLGDVLDVTEEQTAQANTLAIVIGKTLRWTPLQFDVALRLRQLDDQTYWLLNDATYGVLGDTTRLAI